jgi:GWxTD domain-containing protein
MKIRTFLAALIVISLGTSVSALSPEYTNWGAGPVQHLMTKEEAAKWKTITSDDEAKAFALLFWARRDATPDTPRNEFREEFDRRVATADKNFVEGNGVRGSMGERGRAFILYGMPKKIERSGGQRESALPGMAGGGSTSSVTSAHDPYATGGSTEATEGFIWTYEGDEARKLFGQARAQLRFVDRNGKNVYTLERGGPDVARAQARAIEASLAQPNLKAAPTFGAAPAADATAAATTSIPEPAATVQTELTTASLKAAVAEFRAAAKNPYANKAYATWGEFVTSEGEYFVPVQVYVPKSAGINSSQTLTFFGVVQDETGKNLYAFEEPATLYASKDDFFVDRSLTGMPAGKHRGIFGLAANGIPVAIVSSDMTLAGSIDKDAATVSSLILSNNVYPLSAAQNANDPYAFGGLKVVPKGDRTFRPADELWYFIEMRNPGVAEMGAATEGGAAPVAPKVQVKIDVEGTAADGKKVKMSAPPREVEAIEVKGVPGHYGVGSAIPLSSFRPGDYTINVKVIDTVKKASYSLTEKFRVAE